MFSFKLQKYLMSLVLAKLICNPIVVFADTATPAVNANVFASQIKTLEASMQNGRIGVSAINTANQQTLQYRADEAFPFQSTFKVLLAADILQQSKTNNALLKEMVTYSKKDLVKWSPITAEHLKDGMTIAGLCKAAIAYSDNTAANLLIAHLGGVNAINNFANSIGNTSFKLEHIEPNLNSDPNNSADTVTPAAMAQSLQTLILGGTLPSPQQALLVTWMKENGAGEHRIRSGIPKDWIVADKTGSGDFGVANDIGVIWASNCAPIIVTIYTAQSDKNAAKQEAVIAQVTTAAVQQFSLTDACLHKAMISK